MPVEGDILSYLTQHPEAKDTLEGIADWWMLGKQNRPTMAEIKTSLDRLVEHGLVMAEQAGDGRVYYRANRPKSAAKKNNSVWKK